MRKKYRVRRHEVVQPLDQSYRLIPLTQAQNAIVDVQYFEWLSQWNWSASWSPDSHSFYAVRGDRSTGEKVTIWMHREIFPTNKQVDHKNRDSLDNRENNLRECTVAENHWNQGKRRNNISGFKGVHFNKEKRLWQARIKFHFKGKHLGYFSKPEDAAKAYDAMAQKLYGEFAVLNFPESH